MDFIKLLVEKNIVPAREEENMTTFAEVSSCVVMFTTIGWAFVRLGNSIATLGS